MTVRSAIFNSANNGEVASATYPGPFSELIPFVQTVRKPGLELEFTEEVNGTIGIKASDGEQTKWRINVAVV